METGCNSCCKVFYLLSLLFYSIFFILTFTFPIDHSKDVDDYIECKKNITLFSRSKDINEEIEKKCDNIPNLGYFFGNISLCLYSMFHFILDFSILLTGDCYLKFLYLLIPLYLFNLVMTVYINYKSYVLTIRLIFAVFDYIFIILSFSYCCCCNYNYSQMCEKNYKCNADCLDVFFEKRKEKEKEEIPKKIIEIKNENRLLKEGNQKILNEIKIFNEENKLLIIKSKEHTSCVNVENKKIEAIIWYMKKKYNRTFAFDSVYQNLLTEVKNKCNININRAKLKEIFLYYIKEKFTECLSCPLTADIFLNPMITPEGQTFDKSYLLKEIQKTGKNPLTRKNLNEAQLIENKLVRDLCEIFRANYDKFSMEDLLEMRNLLINKNTKKFYINPVIIKFGYKKGETEESNNKNEEYSNKVILNLIEQNKDILSDEFIDSL